MISVITVAHLLGEIETMSEEEAAQVLDFAMFLKSKHTRPQPAAESPSAEEITMALNEIYRENPAVIDEDIQLAQYNLVGDGDW